MKVYLGLFGNYRTFEKTFENLFSHLIDNNPHCSFDIYINTENKSIYQHKKWKNTTYPNYANYTEDELNTLFQKCYKSNLKKITYYTIDGKTFPFYARIKHLINEHNDNNNEKYDLYFFMRIDCIFLKKLDLYNYANKLEKNMIKLICGNICDPNRESHDRDWDWGIVSKNIDNIYKFVLQDFDILTPDDRELQKMAKVTKCNNLFTRYDLPLPSEIEKKYKSEWHYRINCMIYSFNKLVGPLWYEDDFFLSIVR